MSVTQHMAAITRIGPFIQGTICTLQTRDADTRPKEVTSLHRPTARQTFGPEVPLA